MSWLLLVTFKRDLSHTSPESYFVGIKNWYTPSLSCGFIRRCVFRTVNVDYVSLRFSFPSDKEKHGRLHASAEFGKVKCGSVLLQKRWNWCIWYNDNIQCFWHWWVLCVKKISRLCLCDALSVQHFGIQPVLVRCNVLLIAIFFTLIQRTAKH